MNMAVGTCFHNLLDFTQLIFTVDSSKNNMKNNEKRLIFFLFYILHFAYAFVMSQCYLANLHFACAFSVVYSSIKQWSPNSNESFHDEVTQKLSTS